MEKPLKMVKRFCCSHEVVFSEDVFTWRYFTKKKNVIDISRRDKRGHMTSSLQLKMACYDWTEEPGNQIEKYNNKHKQTNSHSTPFNGYTCKSKFYFVEMFKDIPFILRKKTVMETQRVTFQRRFFVAASCLFFFFATSGGDYH